MGLELNWGEETWRTVVLDLTSNTFICYHWGKTRIYLRFFPCPSIRTQPQHNLSVQCILKHWAHSLFSLPGHFTHPLSETGYTFRTSLRLCCRSCSYSCSRTILIFLNTCSSSHNGKELENWYKVLALVCCITFNARKCFPCIWQHFFLTYTEIPEITA